MQSAITRFVSSARREEGAITVVGLFMACFLTGAVWYVVVLATTGMIVGLAILGWGPPLVQSFTFTRALIISPVP